LLTTVWQNLLPPDMMAADASETQVFTLHSTAMRTSSFVFRILLEKKVAHVPVTMLLIIIIIIIGLTASGGPWPC
jgi:hypothetical protein